MANVGGYQQTPFAMVRFINFEVPFSMAIISKDGIKTREIHTSDGQPRLRDFFLYNGESVLVTQDRPAFAGTPIFNLYKMVNGEKVLDSTVGWTQTGQKQIEFGVDISPSLAGYVLQQQINSLPFLAANLSSVTYSPVTDHIYLVENNFGGTGIIHECTRDAVRIRTITWAASGLTEDMEGLCWVEGDLFCAALERSQGTLQQKLVVFRIPDGTSNITVNIGQGGAGFEQDIIEKYTPAITTVSNLGFEGVGYDPVNRLFFAATERNSANNGIGLSYRIVRGGAANNFAVQFDAVSCDVYGQTVGVQGTILNNATFPNNTSPNARAQDISGYYYSPVYNRHYVLTDEGECVFECAPDGRVLSAIRTTAWAARCLNQGEGVTFTPDMSTMWIVGEPNNFSRYALANLEDNSSPSARVTDSST